MKRFSTLCSAFLLIAISSVSQSATDTSQWKSLKNYGGVGNGTTDDFRHVQNFIDSCAKYHYTGYIPDGAYLIDSALKLRSNLKLVFSDNAVFLRGFSAPSGATGSFIQQDSPFSSALSNVTLTNLHCAMKPGATYTGRVMSVWCNDLTLVNLRVDSFSTGICLVLAGDRIKLQSPVIKKSSGVTGEGGIRCVGGADFMCSNAYVESGDDCFQFVPVANPGDPFFNLPISNGTYINCKGVSYAARLIAAANEENNSSRVKNCYFINITGRGSGSNPQAINLSDQSCTPVTIDSVFRAAGGVTKIVVRSKTNRDFPRFNDSDTILVSGNAAFNGTFVIDSVLSDTSFMYTDTVRTDANSEDSLIAQRFDDNRISGITISDVTVAADTADPGPNFVLVDHIRNLGLQNIQLANVKGRAVLIQNLSSNITIEHLNADKASGLGYAAIEIDTSSNVSINAATLYANGTTGILVGSGAGAKSTNVSVRNSKIYNISDNQYGINFNNCLLPTAFNNYFERAAGSTASKGIKTTINARLGKIENNSFDYVDAPYSDADVTNSNVYAYNTPLGIPTVTLDSGAGGLSRSVTLNALANDITGQVTIVTDIGTKVSATIATFTFSNVKGAKPKSVLLTPGNAGAASNIARYFVDPTTISTSSFKLKSTSTALPVSTTLIFNYKVEW